MHGWLQEEVLHWGPNFFSQNGAQPLVYVVVLLMSQHFRRAAEYMGDQAELREHGTHFEIACNHLKVSTPGVWCHCPLSSSLWLMQGLWG